MSTTSNPDNNTSPGTHDIDFALESSPVPSVASLSLHSHDNQDMDVDSVITSIDSVSSTGTSLLARPMTFNEEAIAKQALDRERTLNDRCYQLRMQCILLDAELEKASPEQRPALLQQQVRIDSALSDAQNLFRRAKDHADFIRSRQVSDQASSSSPSSGTGSDKVKLDLDCPRYSKTATGHPKKLAVKTKARDFIFSFKTHNKNALGDHFEREAPRLLILAILDDTLQVGIQDRLKKEPDASWERVEEIFIEHTMTTDEQYRDAEDLAKTGLDKDSQETHRQFAQRYLRIIQVYRIQDDNLTVLTYLSKVFQEMMANITLFAVQLGYPALDGFKSISHFLAGLERVPGPFYNTANNNNNNKKRSSSDSDEKSPRKKKSTQRKSSSPQLHCEKCGDNYTHDTNGCKTCAKCGKKGHVASECRSGRAPSRENQGKYSHKGESNANNGDKTDNTLLTQPDEESTANTEPMNYIIRSRSQIKKQFERKLKQPIDRTNTSWQQSIASSDPFLLNKSSDIYINSIEFVPDSDLISEMLPTVLSPSVAAHRAACIRVHSNATISRVFSSVQYHAPHGGITFANGDSHPATTAPSKKKKRRRNKKKRLTPDDVEGLTADQITAFLNSLTLNPEDGPAVCDFAAISKRNAVDNRVLLDMTIFDRECVALLDTGATTSIISTKIVDELQIKVIPRDGYFTLADKSVHQRIGETVPIEVSYGDITVSAPLEVLDQQYDLTIGMDLFYKFGFSIQGLRDPLQPTRPLSAPEEDERPSLKPVTTPEEELTDKFKAEREAFMRAIERVLEENESIPASSFCPVPEMKVYLPVPEKTILFRRSRHFAEAQRPILDEAVERWLKDGVITLAPAGNPHNNTLTLAAKKDADGNKTLWRVCLDPRPLNAHLPDDNFQLPLISDIMQRIAGHSIYTTIDLTQAYHRLPIHEEDRPLTAFMHNGKQYMFNRAPFGLKPLSSLFQRGMSRILGDLPFVLNFIDDIVIFSKNREEHAGHVKAVIERLNAAMLIINRKKCNFYSTQISLLGFIVDLHCKRLDPSRLVNVHEWADPTTGKMIQSYLGTFNFFREHIPLFSTLSAPLDALRNVSGPFQLDSLQKHCFESLKSLLLQAPVLSFPDFSLPFYVATDASNVGIGVVLFQLPKGMPAPTSLAGVSKDARYISFMARTLQQSERKYSATQKELLAIVFALKKFHYFLWGRHFNLYTDHRALTYLHSQKDLNQMLTAWQDVLFDYNFSVRYLPGARNILPDHLSRQFPDILWTAKPASQNQPVYAYIHLSRDNNDKYVEVPTADREEMLKRIHDFGHFGANKMVISVHAEGKTWPGLGEDCLNYVKRCTECQKFNIVRRGYHPMRAIHAYLPGEHMAVDLAGPFKTSTKGNTYLLVLTDVCTRFVFLRAIADKTAATVVRTLFNIFCDIGCPQVLQSDNGKEFSNKPMTKMCERLGIDQRFTSPHHPRANGLAENRVKTAKQILRKSVQGNDASWDEHVPMTQLAMNTHAATLHNSSPFSLFFARPFKGFHLYKDDEKRCLDRDELLKRLEYMTTVVFPAVDEKARAVQQKMIERFNKTVLFNEFPDGARVMVLDVDPSSTLAPKYEGPYKVIRRNTGGAYVLSDGDGQVMKRAYPPSHLKLVLDDHDLNSETFPVEKILAHHRDAKGDVQYLVQWKGYEEQTWEPLDMFIERECIREYWAGHPVERRNPTSPSHDTSQGILQSDKPNRPATETTKKRNRPGRPPKGKSQSS